MICVYCGAKTSVSNSRHQKKTNGIWRRRKCSDCLAVVTTLEQIDLGSAVMVEKNGKTCPFFREKLLLSIYKSLEHRPKPVEDALGLTNTVLGQLLTQIDSGQLETVKIRETVIKVLNNFDKVAGMHFAAFHPKKIND